MYFEIDQKIYELKEKLRIKEKLQSLRNINMEELEKEKFNLKKLDNILKKEEKDVTKLEGMSISSLFLDIMGKKEDKLDKEKEEYLVAKMKYEECLVNIKEIEEQVEYCNKKLGELYGVNNEYERLIREKERLILKEDSQESRLLRDYQDRIDKLKLEQKELNEAIDAGTVSISSLSVMKDYLEKAKSWGVWDMMGGGLISNMAKHSAIDDANRSGQAATKSLKKFKKELLDVETFTDMELNISSFTKFADFFFDGFFVDWFVQSKINDSLSNISSTETTVNSIISDLSRKLKQVENEETRLNLEIKRILER